MHHKSRYLRQPYELLSLASTDGPLRKLERDVRDRLVNGLYDTEMYCTTVHWVCLSQVFSSFACAKRGHLRGQSNYINTTISYKIVVCP